MSTLERVDQALKEGKLNKKHHAMAHEFIRSHLAALGKESDHNPLLDDFLDFIVEQVASLAHFECHHKRSVKYYDFGMNFIRPLIDWKKSTLEGEKQLEKIDKQIAAGENVIFFGNHQTEPDPQVVSLFFEKSHPKLAEEIIFVAGHRVTTDPVAVPFSLGRNLLCIYSKRHINHPPELRAEKQRHNQRTMKCMSELLAKGGESIYVAPSGGRDRPSENGEVKLAPFDAASIGMFHLMAKKSGTPTHFYPLALSTYSLMPPPPKVEKALGEMRSVSFTPVHLAFGEEIDMERFPGHDLADKKSRREALSEHIFNEIAALYHNFPQG